jgi:hypothetical protein
LEGPDVPGAALGREQGEPPADPGVYPENGNHRIARDKQY